MPMTPDIMTALYSPSQRKIGCVLLAAAFKADRRVNNIVGPKDWFMTLADDMTVMSGTIEEWRKFAAMPPEQRPGPDDFAKYRKDKTAGEHP